MMEEVEDRADVVIELLGKGEGLAAQAADTLAQGVVEALDVIGLPRLLASGLVAFGRKDGGVGVPEVAVADRAHPVLRWQRVPQLASRFCGAVTNCHANHFAGFTVEGEPNPLHLLLVAHVRPELIALEDQAPLFLGVTSS